jgi:threonine dehydratase
MAENATPSKIAATRAYGADGRAARTIWDEANDKARNSSPRGLHLHPSVRRRAAHRRQGTVGLEIFQDWPESRWRSSRSAAAGLISGVATALKACNPAIRVVGRRVVGRAGMTRSVREGGLLTLDASTASSTACA